jgi:hypothetical protein
LSRRHCLLALGKYHPILSNSCPNPSIFNQSAVQIVLSLVYPVSTGVVPNYFLSIVLVIHIFATSKFFMVFFVPYFLTKCFQLRSSQLSSFLQVVQLPRFFGFTRLLRSNLVLPLLSVFISRSRGKISCKWGRVVTTRDRRSRRLPFIFIIAVCFICLLYSSSHHSHCISTPMLSFSKLASVRSCRFFLTSVDLSQTHRSFVVQPFNPLCTELRPLARVRKLPQTRTAWSSSVDPDQPRTSPNIFGLFIGLP